MFESFINQVVEVAAWTRIMVQQIMVDFLALGILCNGAVSMTTMISGQGTCAAYANHKKSDELQCHYHFRIIRVFYLIYNIANVSQKNQEKSRN